MQIYIKAELEAKLRKTSKEMDVPMSQLLAEALENYFGPEELKSVKSEEHPKAENYDKGQTITVPDLAPARFVPKAPDPVMGFPCCQKKAPCKHWKWDGVTESYVNEITGEVKPAEL